MPAVRIYAVEETRQVFVRAESPADAIRIGQAAFAEEDYDFQDIGGYVTQKVRQTSISAKEQN